MSPHDVRERSRAAFTQFCDEASHRLGLGRNPELDLSPDAGHVGFRDPWIHEEEQRALVNDLRTNEPVYVKAIVEGADAICRHEFQLSGFIARYGETVEWQADPVSGKAWPNEFHTRIAVIEGDTADADITYVRELNRHAFLPVLGKAYRLTGDDRYAAAGLALIESWIAANPFNLGINWTSALEAAIRSLSWCWACALFEGSEPLTPARRRRVLLSLSQHARYIERHLSYYVSPGNRLIGEATALFVIGSLLPSLKRAVEWRNRGWSILETELPKQYHDDGGSIDEGIAAHLQTVAFHLQAMLVKRRVDGVAGGWMWNALETAIEFSMQMRRPDGSMPIVGDAPGAQLWDVDMSLAIGAALFDRGDFKKLAGSLPADAWWLVGTSGRHTYEALTETLPAHTSAALPSSGHYIMRTGWDRDAHYLRLHSPTGARNDSASLSIDVSPFGHPLLAAPGITICPDAMDSSELPGTTDREWIALPGLDYVAATCADELVSPVTHRRVVAFLKPHYWVVRDELGGQGEHDVDRRFHFTAADVIREPASGAAQTRLRDGRPNLAVVPVERTGVTLELQGAAASLRAAMPLPCAMHAVLVPFHGESIWVRVATRSIQSDDESPLARAFEVFRPDGRDLWAFSNGPTARFHERWFTDARVVCIRLSDAGQVRGCMLVGGSRINLDGEPIVELDRRVRAATLTLTNGQPVIQLSEPATVVTSMGETVVRKAG